MADVPVGRDRELAVLRDRLTAAEHRPGAVVLVGVAGSASPGRPQNWRIWTPANHPRTGTSPAHTRHGTIARLNFQRLCDALRSL